MKRAWPCLLSILLLLILGLVAAVVVAQSGLVNVAATYPDPKPVEWFLETTSDRSIERRAAGIAVPALDDPAMVRRGAGLYRTRCAACHGAPGVPATDLAKGLNPHPPMLYRFADRVPANELFWVTKNGIRMTGMPAWGPTHSDEDIWSIVAFLKRLPKYSPEEYQKLQKTVPRVMR
jgi:mono/diheme cytochrome c family protein